MTRGALLFAHNSPTTNYYDMAIYAANRINHFLKIPVTLVTDEESVQENSYIFDNVIITPPNKDNARDRDPWFNKGRYQAYEFSPYDETLLIDVDYIINSDKLLKTFDTMVDFCCHDSTSFLMYPDNPQDVLSPYSYMTLWATVIAFRKTERVRQIFECLHMVQENYDHYCNIHNFMAGAFRNDYALTLALRIANGHTTLPGDIIPWDLVHIGRNTIVQPNSTEPFNTEFTIMFDRWNRGKIKKEYITIKDCDIHLIVKPNFIELMANG